MGYEGAAHRPVLLRIAVCAVGQVLGGSSGAVVLASNPAMAAGTDYCQSVSHTQAQRE